jgi:pyridine nucleotide-disulfide oxidoreductase
MPTRCATDHPRSRTRGRRGRPGATRRAADVRSGRRRHRGRARRAARDAHPHDVPARVPKPPPEPCARRSRQRGAERAGVVSSAAASACAAEARRLDVQFRLEQTVESMEHGVVRLSDGSSLAAGTVVWATRRARACDLAGVLAAPVRPGGRVRVAPTLNLETNPEVFVVGDMSYLEGSNGAYQMVARVAMQQGRLAAENIAAAERCPPGARAFRYRDKGQMAMIGRRSALVDAFGSTSAASPRSPSTSSISEASATGSSSSSTGSPPTSPRRAASGSSLGRRLVSRAYVHRAGPTKRRNAWSSTLGSPALPPRIARELLAEPGASPEPASQRLQCGRDADLPTSDILPAACRRARRTASRIRPDRINRTHMHACSSAGSVSVRPQVDRSRAASSGGQRSTAKIEIRWTCKNAMGTKRGTKSPLMLPPE